MTVKTRLFLILWITGLAGVLSILLIDLNALISILPILPGTEVPTITPTLKLITPLQPAVLVAFAVLVGVGLASSVGLSSPAAEAAARGGDAISALKPQIVPGIIGGLAGAISLTLVAAVLKPFLSPDVVARLGEFGKVLPPLTRLLYGGIVEELMLRWGMMTLLVWAAWRLFQKGRGDPKPACFVGAILASSLLFAVGHLPLAFVLFPEPTFALLVFAVAANSAFGLIGGYLYWKKGLESAMIAHGLTHVGLFAASYFGAYF